MANQVKMSKDDQLDWYERTHKHWRSPVGLSIFLLSLALAVWIIAQVI